MIDRLAPTRRPSGPPAGYQKWDSLLFLHWEVPVETLRPLIPAALAIDTFEGRAYVGLVAFTMRDVRPRGLPALSIVSDFHELNVRTYVHREGRDPGVWFFSLDASKSIPVRLARRLWHLPYFRADMALERSGSEVRYSSTRRWPEPVPATFRAGWRTGEVLEAAAPGTFEHFLVERYLLYADAGPQGLKVGQVHHTPYPLQRAEMLALEEDLLRPLGLPKANANPHILYSSGVSVEVFKLRGVE